MLPEYLIAAMVTAVLGWGGFTWRRAEQALEMAHRATDQTDKLELKLAEKYLTKDEFEMNMDRLFKTLARFEEKLDYHVFHQTIHKQKTEPIVTDKNQTYPFFIQFLKIQLKVSSTTYCLKKRTYLRQLWVIMKVKVILWKKSSMKFQLEGRN